MTAFAVSLGIIFLAELGDKSQLVALWFATRYRWFVVLAGVAVATLVVHLGSVVIGRAFAESLPHAAVYVIVGISFFGFGIWSLRGDQLEEEPARGGGVLGPFGVVTVSFFLAELGDKTQLATVSLAGERPDTIAIWLGSTAGMVLADAAAIGVGIVAGARLPHRKLGVVAALLFFAFGAFTIARALS